MLLLEMLLLLMLLLGLLLALLVVVLLMVMVWQQAALPAGSAGAPARQRLCPRTAPAAAAARAFP